MTYEIIIPTIHEADQYLDPLCDELEKQGHPFVIAEGGTFAQNCNAAGMESDAEFLIFLNDDTFPRFDWADQLLAPFADDDVGITGARLLYSDGTVQHAGIWFGSPDGVLTAYNETEELPSRDVDAVTGACLAIRSSLFRALGGFDDGFQNGYEDVDLCLRARMRDWRIRYVAEATVTHYESQSGPRRWAHVGENVARLQELWVAKSS